MVSVALELKWTHFLNNRKVLFLSRNYTAIRLLTQNIYIEKELKSENSYTSSREKWFVNTLHILDVLRIHASREFQLYKYTWRWWFSLWIKNEWTKICTSSYYYYYYLLAYLLFNTRFKHKSFAKNEYSYLDSPLFNPTKRA